MIAPVSSDLLEPITDATGKIRAPYFVADWGRATMSSIALALQSASIPHRVEDLHDAPTIIFLDIKKEKLPETERVLTEVLRVNGELEGFFDNRLQGTIISSTAEYETIGDIWGNFRPRNMHIEFVFPAQSRPTPQRRNRVAEMAAWVGQRTRQFLRRPAA